MVIRQSSSNKSVKVMLINVFGYVVTYIKFFSYLKLENVSRLYLYMKSSERIFLWKFFEICKIAIRSENIDHLRQLQFN